MHHILTTFGGLVPVASTLVPLSMFCGAASAAVRALSPSPRRPEPTIVGQSLVDMSLVLWVLFAAYLVFSPQPESAEQVRLYLGNDLWTALRADPGDLHPWMQLLGNLLLLFPLGALLPLRIGWFDGPTRVAMVAVLAAMLVELVQFLLIEGRVASTDDVVLNTVGATAGAMIGTVPGRRRTIEAEKSGPLHRATGRGGYPVWWLIAEVERARADACRAGYARTRSGPQ